jgi:hypothetical protein
MTTIMRRLLPAIILLCLAGLAQAQDDNAYRRAVDSVVIVWSYDHNWDLSSTGTGPILNQRGELVGLNSATVTTANQVQKGIDISEIRAFLAEYRAKRAQGGQQP